MMMKDILNGVVMEIEDIEAQWAQDCLVDKTQLDVESLKIPQLHSKYSKYLRRESMRLSKMVGDHKALRLELFEHYTQGGSKETVRKGYKLPPIGKVLKGEAEKYIEADPVLIQANLEIAYQAEKVELIKEILGMVSSRQWHIKGAQDYMKFVAGGSVA